MNSSSGASQFSDYIEPFWSSKPLNEYQFEVMKEGAIVEEIDISQKPYYVVGRQQDNVDIFQENPTISRRHAVLQHKDTGDLFVYDLGSTHGTFVNKKLIPKQQYVKLSPGDMLRFGQSTRWFILNGGPDQEEAETEENPRPKIQIISKRQNEQLLIKKRIDQIRKLDEQNREQKQLNLIRLHGNHGANEEEGHDQGGGISWGMGFDEEEEIHQYQKKMMEEEDNEESREGFSGDDEGVDSDDDGQLLDIEKLKTREDLTEKQRQMVSKIDGIRRQIKKIIDKKFKLKNQEELEFDDTKAKSELKGVDKKAHELKEQLERAEAKLRTSLKSKKQTKKEKEEDNGIAVERRKNSDDEEDEFFDRTKFTKFNKTQASSHELQSGQAIETYESIKTKLEQLTRERVKLTDQMHNGSSATVTQKCEDEEDEFEAYMKQNDNQLQLEQQRKLGSQIAQLNIEIERYTKLIALVAPSTFHKAQQVVASEEPAQEIERTQTRTNQPKQSIQSTLHRLKELSQLKEAEFEEKKRKEEEEFRAQQQQQLKESILSFQQRTNIKETGDNEEEQDSEVAGGLEEDSGLKNYFREIVKNANRFGEKIDLSQYQSFIGHYNETNRKRGEPDLDLTVIENEIRPDNNNSRRRQYGAAQGAATRHLHNNDEDERREGEVDDWVPPENQRGDGKTSLNAKFGY